MILIYYVHDLQVCAKKERDFTHLKIKLSQNRRLKDLSTRAQLHGIDHIWHKKGTIVLWQSTFIFKMFCDQKMMNGKAMITPIISSVNLNTNENAINENDHAK